MSKRSNSRRKSYEVEITQEETKKSSRRIKTKEFSRTTTTSTTSFKKVVVTPQTENQRHLNDMLAAKTLTIAVGPAGCGKSYLTAYAAAQALIQKEVLNIFITRSMITVGKDIGFLPGNEVEKMLPYVAPMMEYFAEFFGKEEVAKMLKANIIRVVPLGLLRGYTFKDTFVILDEAQNTTPHEFKTILTRIGEGSKMAVLGDLEQSDFQNKSYISGPEDFIKRIHEEHDEIGFVTLDENDIVRSSLVRDIVKIYKNEY